MRFKTVRLMAIGNGLKRVVSTSVEFKLLQMKSELDTGRCASEDSGPLREVDCEISH